MKVLVIKDGTVPVAVCKVLYTDGLAELVEGNVDYLDVEVFDVEGEPEALLVGWADGDGFSVAGVSFAEGLKDLQTDWRGEPALNPIEEVSAGHLVTTFGSGDNESYGHLFDLRGLR